MNYDDWKQQTPDENELEGKCAYCLAPTNDTYCSRYCASADIY